MSNGLGCRFRASWSEGQAAREGWHDAVAAAVQAGAEPPQPPEQVLNQAAERPMAPSELMAVLRLSRERRLPSLYDPAGVSFAETSPIFLDHVGLEIGRVTIVSRDGDRFSVLGWIHPDYAAQVRACGHVSPGQWIDDARIEDFGGSDVLRVVASSFAELSATAEPARTGTLLEVGPPQRVPSPDWEALLTDGSAFVPEPAAFHDGPDARLRVAFPSTVKVS